MMSFMVLRRSGILELNYGWNNIKAFVHTHSRTHTIYIHICTLSFLSFVLHGLKVYCVKKTLGNSTEEVLRFQLLNDQLSYEGKV